MKKILVLLLICQTLIADCNWKTGIQPLAGGDYLYNKACHIKVGELVQGTKQFQEQLEDLTKAISLKDLAIAKADERAKLWNDTAQNLENRLQQVDKIEKTANYLYFLLGVGTVFLAGIAAAKLNGH